MNIFETLVGQWGARVIGLELGENIAFTQSKIAFARGAARRNGLPWSIQVSQWFNGSMVPLPATDHSKLMRKTARHTDSTLATR